MDEQPNNTQTNSSNVLLTRTRTRRTRAHTRKQIRAVEAVKEPDEKSLQASVAAQNAACNS